MSKRVILFLIFLVVLVVLLVFTVFQAQAPADTPEPALNANVSTQIPTGTPSIVATTAGATTTGTTAVGGTASAEPDRPVIQQIEYLGVVTFPVNYTYADTTVGGLSALAYHPGKEVFYVLSDDRSREDDARFYTVTLAIGDGALAEGDVVFTGVTTLKDETGRAYADGSIDPEGMALTADGTLFISSEGDTDELIDPFVHEYSLDGRFLSALLLPDKFLPTAGGETGIRDNLALESLTIRPDGGALFTAVENALHQDGPESGRDNQSLSRIIQYDLAAGLPANEYVYVVEKVPDAPIPLEETSSNGLVDLIALDNDGAFLALERAFAVGVGNTIILYELHLEGAEDVSTLPSLFGDDFASSLAALRPVQKQFLFDLGTVWANVDNVEGMALGPLLADGRQTLILVSDNNFNPAQQTQFILLAFE